MEKVVITSAFVAWLIVWIVTHLRIRQGRAYAVDRHQTKVNRFYPAISVFMTAQNLLCIATIWSDAPWLLRATSGSLWQWIGLTIIYGATILYFFALHHLGKNYSPCYDSFRPTALVLTGPYRLIRHPMYAAKILLAFGLLCLSGSLWMLPSACYLITVAIRSALAEDQNMADNFPAYGAYRNHSALLLPGPWK